MSVSAIQDCINLLKKHNVPENVVRHSWKVYEVASFLARELRKAGEKINIVLVEKAALLHDIDKHMVSKNQKEHGLLAEKILLEEGFPREAEIARKHHLQTILEDSLNSWEEKIVYYADKRVLHDEIVSLAKRFSYLKRIYGSRNQKALEIINKAEPLVFELEREIFEKIHADKSLSELQ